MAQNARGFQILKAIELREDDVQNTALIFSYDTPRDPSRCAACWRENPFECLVSVIPIKPCPLLHFPPKPSAFPPPLSLIPPGKTPFPMGTPRHARSPTDHHPSKLQTWASNRPPMRFTNGSDRLPRQITLEE
ncbi:hypothetical protein PoB_003735000 [Plakobranchus ocellatus]|uniref:Uncharacterized protein n=1 Tax=Plakobranchus ocellatus TaxID=259542 RepID=A0AAV4AVC4_9GAST|nr:hypothetical protein PoB_003735000 [Plakobranchus ocellatus]